MTEITNALKYIGTLLELGTDVDENDRPVQMWLPSRQIWYEEIGTTSTEQYLALQAKTNIAMRIVVRYDKRITTKLSRIQIGDVKYKIVRIYSERPKQRMELSLAYVD